ncbi:MAG: hypothetical protein Q9P01_00235 [Anaerolineae bacterium]|nr:hypothetical protein [Anaerolineae bacterium]
MSSGTQEQFWTSNKQCHNPHAAVLSVQWSAWVYSIMLLAGYRTWGLSDRATCSHTLVARLWTLVA